MKSLCREIVSILLSCLVSLSVWAGEMPEVEPEEVGLSSERLEGLTAVMRQGVVNESFRGAVAAFARKGKIVYFEAYGDQDKEAGVPMAKDTIFRIASMTKAITGVAVMMLYEEGHFFLNDPVAKYLPAFRDVQVAVNGESDSGRQARDTDQSSGKAKKDATAADHERGLKTVPANRPITIRDLLRHTSGIAYPDANIYEEGMNLGEMIDRLATVPLESHPGTTWKYGMSTDVLARLVEVVSGMSFDDFLEERIFAPLGMKDTAFHVPKEKHSRLVKMYAPNSKEQKKAGKSHGADPYLSPPAILAGGSGLVSTTMDYLRFCQMLLNNGELEGKRILGRKSVELMRTNQMGDVETGYPKAKLGYELGFGLTFAVKPGPEATGELGSAGSYYWGGAYGTSFWIDPVEELTGVFMVNGLKYDLDNYTDYSAKLEHFAYQALIE